MSTTEQDIEQEEEEIPECEHCGGPEGECATCEHCDQCIDAGCECCSECGASYCYGPCSECGECECACCGECESYPCQCSGGYGSSDVAPWVIRGLRPSRSSADRWSEAWPIDRTIDIAQSVGDYYLLEALTGNVLNGSEASKFDPFCRILREEARTLLDALVTRLDTTFRAYVDMVVGGELRYHRALGAGTVERSDAWLEWHSIRQAGGSQILLDASDLFIEFERDTSGFGGTPWAQAAQILHARETGRISPQLFIDRVFNAQHNGGSLLNKLEWAVSNSRGIAVHNGLGRILAAHGDDNFATLMSVASREVVGLVLDYWQACNWVKRTALLPVVPKPDYSADERREMRERRANDLHHSAQLIAAAASCLFAAGVKYGQSYYAYHVGFPYWEDTKLGSKVAGYFADVTPESFYSAANFGKSAPWLAGAPSAPPVKVGTVPGTSHDPHVVTAAQCNCCAPLGLCAQCLLPMDKHMEAVAA